MKDIIFNFYLRSPQIVKRIFANIEAIRRDKYRRIWGQKPIVFSEDITGSSEEVYIEKINSLLRYASENCDYYSFLRDEYTINQLKDFSSIPLLSKQDIRDNAAEIVSNITNIKKLWKGSTSGSTGTPLRYYRDVKSVNNERLWYDAYYSHCGCDINDRHVRLSGVKVASFDKQKPPYWIYIDKYKQLQCSAYHISRETYREYIKAFIKYETSYATGYPSCFSALASFMYEDGISYDGFKAIITDSEGLLPEDKEKIEKAFKCNVFKTYGLAEVGMFAVQCASGNYHILPSHYVEIVDSTGKVMPDGIEGEIAVTDLNSFSYPFIRYKTGDLGIIQHNACECGLSQPYLTDITGRVEDYILTPEGRKITRLTLIVKPAVGVKESQIIQISADEIIINVVPDHDFDENSMQKVLDTAKNFVGNMKVSWRIVDQLERMPSGKLKFLVRKI